MCLATHVFLHLALHAAVIDSRCLPSPARRNEGEPYEDVTDKDGRQVSKTQMQLSLQYDTHIQSTQGERVPSVVKGNDMSFLTPYF